MTTDYQRHIRQTDNLLWQYRALTSDVENSRNQPAYHIFTFKFSVSLSWHYNVMIY